MYWVWVARTILCGCFWLRGVRGDGLFDLNNDPFEGQNLVNNPAYASKLSELKARMEFFKANALPAEDTVKRGSPNKLLQRNAGGEVPWVDYADKPPKSIDRGTPLSSAPHIVFVLLDDVGSNDLSVLSGTQGSTWVDFATPNLKLLAESGIQLTNYYSNWICAPTRASFLTGRNANRLGFAAVPGTGESNLPLSERTLAQELRGLGYMTALVGKWFGSNPLPTQSHHHACFDY